MNIDKLTIIIMRRTLLFSAVLGGILHGQAREVAPEHSFIPESAWSHLIGETIQNTVRGTVSDANGPLPGVTVSLIGSTVTTQTDAEGRFTISAPVGSTLRFSSVGYTTTELTVSSSSLSVEMQSDATAVDEVVVVGYGTQKRSNITGAVSTVDTEKTFETRPITDVGR